MEKEVVVKHGKVYRCGYTTGSCATAAAKAAAWMLFSGRSVATVAVRTPKGIELNLDVLDIRCTKESVSCCIEKDAGDDPDVTHGLKIYAAVTLQDHGITVQGGRGIGRVTKPGLKVKVGRAAINPVPKQMIREAIKAVCEEFQYTGGVLVVLSVPGGEVAAKKTFNPRLGIVGGISILGTTGIVEPMSEKALVDTIHTEMAMCFHENRDRVMIAIGNYGLAFIRRYGRLKDLPVVKCGNYIGEALDHAVYLGYKQIFLVGHIGKMVKLAGGIMDTHSRVGDCRMEILAAHMAMAGACGTIIKEVMAAVTAEEALRILSTSGCSRDVRQSLRDKTAEYINHRVHGCGNVDFAVFQGEKEILYHSLGFPEQYGGKQ